MLRLRRSRGDACPEVYEGLLRNKMLRPLPPDSSFRWNVMNLRFVLDHENASGATAARPAVHAFFGT